MKPTTPPSPPSADPPGPPRLQPAGGWPADLWRVPYDPAAIPGVQHPPSWLQGSNCQRFAYGVLGLFGFRCPPLRSSDLWADCGATVAVPTPQSLDLLLFSADGSAFGAHVGIWVGGGVVLHLCRQVGLPAMWALADFATTPRYAALVGIKRMRAIADSRTPTTVSKARTLTDVGR